MFLIVSLNARVLNTVCMVSKIEYLRSPKTTKQSLLLVNFCNELQPTFWRESSGVEKGDLVEIKIHKSS